MARSCALLGILLSVITHPGATRGADPVAPLQLRHAWSVAGPGRFDASGLACRNGEFFVVSDRHRDAIFRLHFDGEAARAEPAVHFSGPEPYPEKGYLDLEGIACAPDGGFFVASEWGFAVAHVPAAGGRATWVTPDLRGVGKTVGLFATVDAYLEGVALLADDRLLVAIEREPRGLIEVVGLGSGSGTPRRVAAQMMDTSRFPGPPARRLDFADLCTWRGRVFALARNQHLVVELRRDAAGGWEEGDAWSYADVENAAPYRFVEMTFGHAEGLAIDDAHIYVMLDNNAVARAGNPDDRRTWLFEFENPLRPAGP